MKFYVFSIGNIYIAASHSKTLNRLVRVKDEEEKCGSKI